MAGCSGLGDAGGTPQGDGTAGAGGGGGGDGCGLSACGWSSGSLVSSSFCSPSPFSASLPAVGSASAELSVAVDSEPLDTKRGEHMYNYEREREDDAD